MKPSSRRIWLTTLAFLFLTACLFLAVLAIDRAPLFSRYARTGPTIRWGSLPVPRTGAISWTSFSNTDGINDFTLYDGLLWAATDGGVLVWEWPLIGASPAKFSSEHGLAGNLVRSVAVGLDGRLWFGSNGGISSYDGLDWQAYSTGDGLLANDIRDLAFTPDGRLWAATSAGVNVFDGQRWRAYDQARALLQLPSASITALTVLPDGTLAAGTPAGAALFNGRRWTDITPPGSAAATNFRDLAATTDGALWAASAGGLQRYDGQSWQLFTNGDGLPSDNIAGVTPAAAGGVWLHYGDRSVITRFILENGILTLTTFTPPTGLPDAPPRAIFDQAGALFMGTAQGGFWQEAGTNWQPIPGAGDLPLSEISEFAQGPGGIWVGGREGVAQQTASGWTLTPFTQGAVAQMAVGAEGLPVAAFAQPGQGIVQFTGDSWQPRSCPITGAPSAFVRGGVRTGDGAFWFATTAGVARYDGQIWQVFGAAQGLPSEIIQTIAADPAGNVWAGTPAGLARYKNGWQTVNNADVRLLSIGQDGRIWFITEGEIVVLDKETARSVTNPQVSQVYAIAAASTGLWLAADEGLFFYDGQVWSRRDNQRTTAIALAEDDHLWVAQQGAQASGSHPLYGSYVLGENLLTLVGDEVKRTTLLPTPIGLPHPVVTGIKQAANGDIWASSLGGMARYDGTRWQMFGAFDGLPSPVVYDFALSGDSVWTVGPAGVATYDGQTWRPAPELNTVWPFFEDVRITATADGRIWLGGGAELRVWQEERWQESSLELPPDLELRHLSAYRGRLWALGAGRGPAGSEQLILGQFAAERWTWETLDPPNGLAQGRIELFQAAADGRLWLGNPAGLWFIDPATADGFRPAVQQVRGASALTFRSAGQPIAASYAQSQLFFPDGDEEMLDIPAGEQQHLFAILAAADGSIWVGSDRGLARMVPEGGWELYPLTERDVTQLISAMAIGPDGAIWMGTFQGETWQLAADGHLLTFPDQVAPADIPVSVLIPTGRETIWKGSFGASLARLAERRWQRFPHTTELFAATLFDLAVGGDGRIWLGSEAGLLAMDLQPDGDGAACTFDDSGEELLGAHLTAGGGTNLWVYQAPNLWRGDGQGFERVAALVQPVTAVAPDGAFWVASDGRLLRIVDAQQQPLSTAGLPGEITAIAIAPNGTVLAGTTAGLGIFSGGSWQLLTVAEGLPGNEIRQVAVGLDGRVWVLTEGGLGVGRP